MCHLKLLSNAIIQQTYLYVWRLHRNLYIDALSAEVPLFGLLII